MKKIGQIIRSGMMNNMHELTKELRETIVDLHEHSKTSHIGSSLSCIDILAVLYFRILNLDPTNPTMKNRDRFILSKGHAAPALYAVLQKRGFFPKQILERYGEDGTILFEHPEKMTIPGIEASTGSLGHGLAVGLGMAYYAKLNCESYRTFVLLSDGECQEGSVWEAAMLAASLKIGNLIAIVDYNNLQGFGRTDEIQSDVKISSRFEASGWVVLYIDGHNLQEIEDTIKNIPENGQAPVLILAKTTKGKGIKEIEDKLEWHYKSPTLEQAKSFKTELRRK
ncbi:MAG: transketolase [Thermoplasmatales archaeon]